jgi:hypothetical protein
MKLVSITWRNTPRVANLRQGDTVRITCDTPGSALEGWRVVIRGPHFHFISPPGWARDQSVKTRDPQAPRVVFGPVSMNDASFEWLAESDADVSTLLKGKIEFESPPFGWKPAPIVSDRPILDQLPAGQLGDA